MPDNFKTIQLQLTLSRSKRNLLYLTLSCLLYLSVIKDSETSSGFVKTGEPFVSKITSNTTGLGIVFPPYSPLRDFDFFSKYVDTQDELPVLLKTIAELHFYRVSTQSMRHASSELNKRIVSPGEKVGLEAAKYNNALHSTRITVSLGLKYFSSSDDMFDSEIKDTVLAAHKANNIHPGTVTSIVLDLGPDYCSDMIERYTEQCAPNWGPVQIRNAANFIHENGLQFGLRSYACELYFTHYKKEEKIQEFSTVWSHIDIFVCHGRDRQFLNNNQELIEAGKKKATECCSSLEKWTNLLKASGLNNRSVVIGEFNWFSEGVDEERISGTNRSVTRVFGSPESFEAFWTTLLHCSRDKNLLINVFNVVDDKLRVGESEAASGFAGRGWLVRKERNHSDIQGNTTFTTCFAIPRNSSLTEIPKAINVKNVKSERNKDLEDTNYNVNLTIGLGTLGEPDRNVDYQNNLAIVGLILFLIVLCVIGCLGILRVSKNYKVFELRSFGFNENIELRTNSRDTDYETPENADTASPHSLFSEPENNPPHTESEGDFTGYSECPLSKCGKSFGFTLGKIIGSGNYGDMYQGTLEINGKQETIAWKISKLVNEEDSILLGELKTLSMPELAHKNIVRMVMHVNLEGHLGIGLEYCEGGSLKSRLEEIRLKQLTISGNGNKQDPLGRFSEAYLSNLPQLLSWSRDIACGMEHLGSLEVVHADLAARNILLDSNGTAKISDFGLACRLYQSLSSQKPGRNKVALQWAAYESITRLVFNTNSDVWSYGITLFEIFSIGEIPFPGLYDRKELVNLLRHGGVPRNPFAMFCDMCEIYDKMKECWNLNPDMRPTFTHLKMFFEDFTIPASLH